jgi:hypothetical protein
MQCIDGNDLETVQELLGAHMSTQHAKALVAHRASGTRTHDYSISAAQSLSISTAMPKEVYAFTQLFHQPTPTRQSVEYVPVPYGWRRGQSRS